MPEVVKSPWLLRGTYAEGTSSEEILRQEAKLKSNEQMQQHRQQQLEKHAREYLKKSGSGLNSFGNTDYTENKYWEKQIYDAYNKALNPKYKPINIRNLLDLDDGIPLILFEHIQKQAYYTEYFFKTVFNVDLEPREIGLLASKVSFKEYLQERDKDLEEMVEIYTNNLKIVKQAFKNKKNINLSCKTLELLGAKKPIELVKAKYVIDNYQPNQKRKLLFEILDENFPFITQESVLNKIYKSSPL